MPLPFQLTESQLERIATDAPGVNLMSQVVISYLMNVYCSPARHLLCDWQVSYYNIKDVML